MILNKKRLSQNDIFKFEQPFLLFRGRFKKIGLYFFDRRLTGIKSVLAQFVFIIWAYLGVGAGSYLKK
jgi:hypothetical protein